MVGLRPLSRDESTRIGLGFAQILSAIGGDCFLRFVGLVLSKDVGACECMAEVKEESIPVSASGTATH